MPDPGVRDTIVNTPRNTPRDRARPGPVAPTYPGPGPSVQDMFADMIGGMQPGGPNGADRSAALKDIALQRRQLAWQKKTGLRDIQQERVQGLRAAVNNALQRGIFDSGIRVENEALVNRESNEATADLKQQIDFALEALKNREGAIRAGGGGGGGGGLSLGDILGIISRVSGFGTEFGWSMGSPWGNPEDRGAPGYGHPGGGDRSGPF